MRWNWRTMMTVVGLGATLASSTLVAGCVVRARGRVTTEPVYVVDEAPPPPREERISVRPGYVWIRGRWESRGGEWVWVGGNWQRERRDHVWEPGHWERRGGRYYWVDGRWVVVGRARVERTPPPEVDTRDHRREPDSRDHRGEQPVRDHRGEPDSRDHRGEKPVHTVTVHPSEPPPAPRPERAGRRAGYVWVAGYYRWENGGYQWVGGHWERERPNMVWEPGHWERRGGHYEWVEGSWRRR
jgi:hypothetical protein